MKTPEEIVCAVFRAYETKDREAIEPLIAPGFTFTSPLDDRISREDYFRRCWPNSEHLDAFELEKIFAQGDEVFVQYRAHPRQGAPFRNTEFFTIRDGQVTHVDVYFGRETAETATREEIAAVLESWAGAIRRKDAEALAAHFAPDSVRYSPAPPLRTEQAVHENAAEWFATWRGDLGYELRDLAIHTAGDLACCTSLNHLTGTKTDGEQVDLWLRETLCLRQLEGRWLIVHEHESVPFLMDGSFKAAIDLKPN